MPGDLPQIIDGDNVFIGVDCQTTPHLISNGYVSNAVNRIFENNTITNRWGIIEPVWGGVWGENVAGNFNAANANATTLTRINPTIYNHAANRIITGDVSWRSGTTSVANLVIQSGTRVLSDNGTTLVIDKGTLMPINTTTFPLGISLATYNSTVGFSNIVGILPYNYSQTNTDGFLIAVNEARSDGGNGRIFFVSPSQPPYEIKTNGYDFYTNVKFVQCSESVVLLRTGNLRSYFNGEAGAVKITYVSQNSNIPATIFSATSHGLKTGDFIYSDVAISGTNNIVANTLYYVTFSDINAFYLSTVANPTTAFFYNATFNLNTTPVTFQRGYIKLNAEADFETGDSIVVGQVKNSKALWEYKNTTAVISSNSLFTKNAHGFENGSKIVILTYTGSVITVGYNYFIVKLNDNTFNLSLSLGGAAITGLTNGNCTLSLATSISTFYANVQGNRVSLHATAANARSQTSALTFKPSSTVSSNSYYFELQNNSSINSVNERANDWENDSPPMIMQPIDQTLTGSALIQGFKGIPASKYISQYDADLDTITVPNHGFVAGDKVVISNISGVEFWHSFDNDDSLDDLQITSDFTFYVYPIDSNTLNLYKNRTGTSAAEDSLTKSSRALGVTENSTTSVKVLKAGSGYTSAPAIRPGNLATHATITALTSVIDNGKVVSVTGVAPASSAIVFEMPNSLIDIRGTTQVIATIKKFGANAQSIPFGRDGIYFQGRLLVLFGPDNLAASDILDPLHYSPIFSVFKLSNVGSDNVVSIYPFNATTIIVFKEKSIFSISNIQGDLSQVVLTEITREYGCIAPLSIAGTGSDVIFLSQRGVISLKQTEFGISQSVTIPLSKKIDQIIKSIDPQNASKSTGIYFENRYFLSFPVLSNNTSSKGLNTRLIIFNFVLKEWEGYWESDMLMPKYWVNLLINKKNYLAWADSSGFIRYFDSESFVDRYCNGITKEIETLVEFRAYSGKTINHKQWTDMSFQLSTNNPTYNIEALFDGTNEIQKITLSPETKNKIKYLTYGTNDYVIDNSKDDFLNPYREDYSVSLTTGVNRFKLGLNGLRLKIKQTFLHKAKLKKHGASIQFKLTTTTGNVDVLACEARGVPFRLFGKIDS